MFYFTSNVVKPPITLFMGEDKYENEELIKWGKDFQNMDLLEPNSNKSFRTNLKKKSDACLFFSFFMGLIQISLTQISLTHFS